MLMDVRLKLSVINNAHVCSFEGTNFTGPVAQLVRAPPCHGGGRGFEPLPGRLLASIPVLMNASIFKNWGLSSAGRASALQAEGHRFEPCRPHYGWFPEWPKGTDCKSAVIDFGGSNPPPPI